MLAFSPERALGELARCKITEKAARIFIKVAIVESREGKNNELRKRHGLQSSVPKMHENIVSPLVIIIISLSELEIRPKTDNRSS